MNRGDELPPTRSAEATLSWWHASRFGLTRLRDDIRDTRTPPYALRDALLGKTDAEVETWFHAQLAETEHLARFAMLAVAEALLMTDFGERCRRRGKDALSVKLRSVAKRAKRRVALDPDVLEAWMHARPDTKSAMGQLRGHFKYRHWVAHGRYWAPKLGFHPVSPQDLADALAKIMTKLGVSGWR